MINHLLVLGIISGIEPRLMITAANFQDAGADRIFYDTDCKEVCRVRLSTIDRSSTVPVPPAN